MFDDFWQFYKRYGEIRNQTDIKIHSKYSHSIKTTVKAVIFTNHIEQKVVLFVSIVHAFTHRCRYKLIILPYSWAVVIEGQI